MAQNYSSDKQLVLNTCRSTAPSTCFIHPGATTLCFTGIKVEVERTNEFAANCFKSEKSDIWITKRVPDLVLQQA